MLNKIIKFSLNNRMVVLVASILLMLTGTYTAVNMEVDVFPDLNAPTVVVMTEAKGMAPEEVERLVTFPVETALNGATDVRMSVHLQPPDFLLYGLNLTGERIFTAPVKSFQKNYL